MSGSGHCSQCAAVNPHTAVFCSACGARLAWAQNAQWVAPATSQPQVLPAQQPGAAPQPGNTQLDPIVETAAEVVTAGCIYGLVQSIFGHHDHHHHDHHGHHRANSGCCGCLGCGGCLSTIVALALLALAAGGLAAATGG